jgi:oxygen-independent coproporphyrinogen III oxidase
VAAIYIHIPFCKQACTYCDFHFSTNRAKKDDMVLALAQEIIERKTELKSEIINAIYFGGGTPSVLSVVEIEILLNTVANNYTLADALEITLEANPDDLSDSYLELLSKTKINRLSIGVQSFFNEDLVLMNRAHNANEALYSIKKAKTYFKNISIDLIYGVPNMPLDRWKQNVDTVLELEIPHISSYALTVESKTVLQKQIETGKVAPVNEKMAKTHFDYLVTALTNNGYDHYEISNFSKPNFYSLNNSNYWSGGAYLGIGPGAHSFDGVFRSWNVANNSKYIKAINAGIRNYEKEELTEIDRYNEYIMTGLRTQKGVSISVIKDRFGIKTANYFIKNIQKHIEKNTIYIAADCYKTTQKGKFLSDGISSDLFLVNLN